MDTNVVVIGGRLTKVPEVSTLPSGAAVAKFSIATTRVWYADVQGGEKEKREETSFIDIVVFGRAAENCGKYLEQGQKVTVTGRIQQSRWEDKQTGAKRSRVQVVADGVDFGAKARDKSATADVDEARPTTPARKTTGKRSAPRPGSASDLLGDDLPGPGPGEDDVPY